MQRERGQNSEAIISEALRHSLRLMANPIEESEFYRTPTVDLGRCRIGALDDIPEVLAASEGDGYR